jgi:Lon protease-like protein
MSFSNTPLALRSPLSKTSSSTLSITEADVPLDASDDARGIVRLAQCPQCSYPFRDPVTLPCGNSLCKKCIPELHPRRNISYPGTPNRLQGFTCPFTTCGADHAIGDCSVDVVLNKIMDVVRREVEVYRNSADASRVLLRLEERDKWSIAGMPSLRDEAKRDRVLPGGRLVSTYTMAEMGELAHDSEVIYTSASPMADQSDILNTEVLQQLKEATRSELDCQVCYSLFLDPYTTTCGHTFCRNCLQEVLNHSNLCPVCRRVYAIPPGVDARSSPSNVVLTNLLAGLCPDALNLRMEAATLEKNSKADLDLSLFVCTLSFPTVPTFLHIFEPRYRLMIRRTVESGDRKFGMLLHNPSREPQGNLGRVHFYEYGTLLHIVNMHLTPDGRSLIETVGVSRFRVVKHGTKDDYTIGKVERIDDISIAAEEELEARETLTPSIARNFSAQDHFGAPPHHTQTRDPKQPVQLSEFNTMSTQELFEVGVDFVTKMREQSAPWLHTRVFQVYGQCPNDPALFPWWFASVLPTADAEKYKLLSTSSVRERLKMCAEWIVKIEAQRA